MASVHVYARVQVEADNEAVRQIAAAAAALQAAVDAAGGEWRGCAQVTLDEAPTPVTELVADVPASDSEAHAPALSADDAVVES